MSKKRFSIPKKLIGKKLEGEWVFLNLANGEYYSLNETGSFIWDELKKNKDPHAILDRLRERFPAAWERLEKDLEKFLNELKAEGLLEVEDVSQKA